MLHFGLLDIGTDVFLFFCAVLLFLLQCFLCFRVKRRWLRLLPVSLLTCAALSFGALAFVFDGWDSIGFLFLALWALCLLVPCGLSWGTWWLIKRRRKKE